MVERINRIELFLLQKFENFQIFTPNGSAVAVACVDSDAADCRIHEFCKVCEAVIN